MNPVGAVQTNPNVPRESASVSGGAGAATASAERTQQLEPEQIRLSVRIVSMAIVAGFCSSRSKVL
jgi:hypothetical protein